MGKYEARVQTKFGKIVLNFDSTDELKSKLDELDVESVSEILSKRFGSILVREPRQPKPGWEHAYGFTPEGKVELLKTPPSAPMTIGLLLYAYDPEPTSSDLILSSTGVKAVSYVSQTDYKKFFDKTSDGKFVLTHPGREWVETEVFSKLNQKRAKKARP